MEDNACVIWIDNFNQNWANGTVTSAKNIYTDCNWTGVGMKEFNGIDGPDQPAFVIDQDHPAMPNTMSCLKDTLVKRIAKRLPPMSADPGRDHNSYCDLWLINEVPLILREQEGMTDALCNTLDQSKGADHLTFWHPKDLLPHNIGANIGLLNVIKQLVPGVADGTGTQTKHIIVNSDCNIYHRINKVCGFPNNYHVFKNVRMM